MCWRGDYTSWVATSQFLIGICEVNCTLFRLCLHIMRIWVDQELGLSYCMSNLSLQCGCVMLFIDHTCCEIKNLCVLLCGHVFVWICCKVRRSKVFLHLTVRFYAQWLIKLWWCSEHWCCIITWFEWRYQDCRTSTQLGSQLHENKHNPHWCLVNGWL